LLQRKKKKKKVKIIRLVGHINATTKQKNKLSASSGKGNNEDIHRRKGK